MNENPTYLSFFQRQTILKEFGEEAQTKLANAAVLIIGCGGLGSTAAVYLAGSGIGKLQLIDFDTIDLSNLHRQVFYKLEDVGEFKALHLAKHIEALTPFTKVTYNTLKIDKQNIFECIKDYDLIVDCTDKLPVKYLINDACVLKEKPLIYGSLYKFDGYVASFNINSSANLRDAFPEMANNIPNCSEVGTLNGIVGIIGNLQANEAIKIITGIGIPIVNEILIYNSLENSQFKMKLNVAHTSRFERKQWISKVFELETYKDEVCDIQDESLFISPEELHKLLVRKQSQRNIDFNQIKMISVIENTKTKIPFKVEEKIPFSEFKRWLDCFEQNDALYIIICNKGVSSYQATQLMKANFLNKMY